jgi:hypothetical protein
MSMAGTRWLRTGRARRLLSDLSSRAGEERSSIAIKMLFHHVAVEKLGQAEEGPQDDAHGACGFGSTVAAIGSLDPCAMPVSVAGIHGGGSKEGSKK